MYMHAHAHTDTQIYGSQEVQEAFEHSHQCREQQLTSQPSERTDTWVGAATNLGDRSSATLNWGSWQKGSAGRAHAGTRKAKELKPSSPVKKCG